MGRIEHLNCSKCGKKVSTTFTPHEMFILRAWVECPECIEANEPKPAQSRLLTLEELTEIDHEIHDEGTCYKIEDEGEAWLYSHRKFNEAQDAKTAEIKDDEKAKEGQIHQETISTPEGLHEAELIETYDNGKREGYSFGRADAEVDCQARIEALIAQLKESSKLIIRFCNQEKARADVDKDALLITMRDMIHDMTVGVITEATHTSKKE